MAKQLRRRQLLDMDGIAIMDNPEQQPYSFRNIDWFWNKKLKKAEQLKLAEVPPQVRIGPLPQVRIGPLPLVPPVGSTAASSSTAASARATAQDLGPAPGLAIEDEDVAERGQPIPAPAKAVPQKAVPLTPRGRWTPQRLGHEPLVAPASNAQLAQPCLAPTSKAFLAPTSKSLPRRAASLAAGPSGGITRCLPPPPSVLLPVAPEPPAAVLLPLTLPAPPPPPPPRRENAVVASASEVSDPPLAVGRVQPQPPPANPGRWRY